MPSNPRHGRQASKMPPSSPALERQRPPMFPGSSISSPGSAGKSRTGHACDRCRAMRTKCSGGTRCGKCIKDDTVCVYGDRKRERNKKDLAESVDRIAGLEHQNRNLLAAVRTLISTDAFSLQAHPEIREMLAAYSTVNLANGAQESETQTPSLRSPLFTDKRSSRSFEDEDVDADADAETDAVADGELDGGGSVTGSGEEPLKGESRVGGEEQYPSSIGSPGRQAELSKVVDLDQGKGAVGWFGKMSEMTWLSRAQEYLLQGPPTLMSEVQMDFSQQSKSSEGLAYFMDDQDLLAIDEDHVNPLERPPFDMAVCLAEACFESTRGAFLFIRREEFFDTMYHFPGKDWTNHFSERRWLAVANLVWAIGSKWLWLTKLDSRQSEQSHLVYYARARALGLDHRMFFDHPDISTVAGLGLLSFYLLSNGSVSKAWNIVGHALRLAVALGLQLKVSDTSISLSSQQLRARVWFSLYNLETLTVEITGRPQSIDYIYISTAIELVEQEEFAEQTSPPQNLAQTDAMNNVRQTWLNFLRPDIAGGRRRYGANTWPGLVTGWAQSSQSHFVAHVKLCKISRVIAQDLYNALSDRTWAETQHTIETLQQELAVWANEQSRWFLVDRTSDSGCDMRAQMELTMYFHSLSMVLHRPCLCEIHIESESASSKQFNITTAQNCVRAAIAMLNLLPDEPAAPLVAQILPWWALLHYTCQAGSVLLLELMLGIQHFQGRQSMVVDAMKKSMSYLRCLAGQSLSAYKAWRILRHFLIKIAPRYARFDDRDIAGEILAPPSWDMIHETSLLAVLE